MELTSGILSRDQYLRAIARVIEFLTAVGVRELSVAYGFGCDCPDEQLYQDVPVPLDGLQSFITTAERLAHYRVGKDNLHVKDGTGRIEFMFCHEADIHFISEDKELVDRLKAIWVADGYCKMFEHLGTEWQPVSVNEKTIHSEQGATADRPRD